MKIDPQLLANQGLAALRRGDAGAARRAFAEVEASGRATPQLRLLLAHACLLLDDRAAAHAALDAVLAQEPANLQALIMRGDLLIRAGDPRAAVAWYQAALSHAPRVGALPADVREGLHRAERAVADAGASFEAHLHDALASAGIAPGGAGPRFAEALDLLTGRVPVQLQQPTSFYYPRLAARPFFERAEFGWSEAFEAAAPAIRAELESILAEDAALSPYVVAEQNRPTKRHPLLDDVRWSAFHLYRRGEPVAESIARCPTTLATLDLAPIPHIRGRSPMALFSVLRPGTHIPPHHGMLNTRLICHLPLIVPPGCRLRVGNDSRAVEADRLMIFDDSMEHEARNDSGSTRAILLFEVWRPELAADERAALTALYEAIELYAPSAGDQAGA